MTIPSDPLEKLTPEQKREYLRSLLKQNRPANVSRPAPIARVSREGPLPLSFTQERLWFLSHLGDGAIYNLSGAFVLRGALDPNALAFALGEIFRRHEVFRVSYARGDDGKPVQRLRPPFPVVLSPVDLSGQPEEARKRALRDRWSAQAARPFDLERGPLFAVELVRLAEAEHVLLLTAHHLTLDIVSREIFLNELGAIYEAALAGRPSPLPEPTLQYVDWAVHERQTLTEAALAKDLEYWTKRLAGAPGLLELPWDHPRPRVQSFGGAQVRGSLTKELTSALQRVAREANTTLNVLLLTAYQVMLSKLSGERDILVGSPASTRNRAELESIIGPFINSLVMRLDVDPKVGFSELLTRARHGVLEAVEHRAVPFEWLVERLQPERDLSHSPVFQTWFFFQNEQRAARTQPLEIAMLDPEFGAAMFDLTLHAVERGGAIDLDLNYATALFEPATAERLLGFYRVLLEQVARAPTTEVGRLTLLGPEEWRRVFVEWNDTARPIPELTVANLVEEQARKTPDATAVVCGEQSWSYRELDERANAIASELVRLGAGPDSLLGICVERSLEMLAAALAVLKAGAAYVPFDPEYPRERLERMVAESGVRLMLVQERLRDLLPEGPVPISLDRGLREPEAPPRRAKGEHLAYGIFTSGTTGRPKLTLISQRAFADHILSVRELHPLEPGDAVLQLFSFSFDASTREMFWPLVCGGRVILSPNGASKDPELLRDLVERHQIKAMQCVPSMLRLFLDGWDHRCRSLRRVFCGGEGLSWELAERVFATAPGVELHNVYGLTETTCDSTTHQCVPGEPRYGAIVPIGRPFPNVRIYLLDASLAPVPVGIPGEMYVGGELVARGYHQAPDLTAERFLPDPFSDQPDARMYRTGDLARWLPNGELEFVRRADTQVKVRGFRIEPAEIESVLLKMPGVRQAAVIVREDTPGDRRLVAYLAIEGASLDGLRDQLREQLPDYMIPRAWVELPELPLSSNGKLDVRRLPVPTQAKPVEAAAPAHEGAAKILADLWRELLGVDAVRPEDDFFDLGGDSLLTIDLVSRAGKAGLKLTPAQVFENPVFSKLVALCEEGGTAPDATPTSEAGEFPLTPLQRWFFEQQSPEPDFYNVRPLVLAVPAGTDAALLEAAWRAVGRVHGSLRLRFTRSGEQVVQRYAEELPPFEQRSVSATGEARTAEVTRVVGELQRSLSLERGPVAKAALIRFADSTPPWLVLIAHHLVVDAQSQLVLLEDLARAFTELSHGREPNLASPTSYGAWSQALERHARSAELEAELAHWGRLTRGPARSRASEADASRHSETLSVAATEALQRSARALGVSLQELLLAKLAEAFREAGLRSLRVDLSGHGKEDIAGVDVSRTVGWFTSAFPIELPLEAGSRVESTAAALRAVPRRGFGFGLLRYLGSDAARSALREVEPALLSFNFIGQVDGTLDQARPFTLVPGEFGLHRSARTPRPHPFVLIALIVEQKLALHWEWAETPGLSIEGRLIFHRYLTELQRSP